MPHFQLVLSPSGDVLGLIELQRPDWPIGAILHVPGHEPELRVIDAIDTTDDPEMRFKVLVVEEV